MHNQFPTTTNSLSYKSDSDTSSLSMGCKEVSQIPQKQFDMFQKHITCQNYPIEEFSLSDTISEYDFPQKEEKLQFRSKGHPVDTLSRVSSFSNLEEDAHLRKNTFNTRVSVNSEGNQVTEEFQKKQPILQEKVEGKESGRRFSGLFFRQNSQNNKGKQSGIDWDYFANLNHDEDHLLDEQDTKIAGVKAISERCIARKNTGL